jgi:signal transduction histidine kinase
MNPRELSRVKLAATYLAIIMTMSIVFSVVIYNVSSHELDRGLRRPPQNVRENLLQEFDDIRQARLEESRSALRERLIAFNLITLIFGAALSYTLARSALRPIEESIDAQNRFTSDASHELRTPLTVMRSEIEVALRDPKLPTKESRAILESNLEEVTKLEQLTSGLLQLARQEQGNLEFQKINLDTVIKEAIDRQQKSANSKKIHISYEPNQILITGEQTALTQLIGILLDNAIKYSPQKSEVSIIARKDRRDATITITDHGQGIEQSDLPHIFERFYRSDKAREKTSTNGYGLGLSIAEQIAHQHGGSITIKSTPGQGTTAEVHLPLTR